MKIMKQISIISLVIALSACIYVPVVDENKVSASSCETYTKSMSLKQLESQSGGRQGYWLNCSGNEKCYVALLTTVAVVSAGSVVISGSIVGTANTVHWLEYQGTCSDGYLNIAKQRYLESENKPTPAI